MNLILKRFLTLLTASLLAWPVLAQDGPSRRVVHFVKSGETMEQIAKQYLNDADAAEELRAYNQVAPEAAVEPGIPIVIPGSDRSEAVEVLVKADAAMRAATAAKASEFALDEFRQAVDVLNAAVKSRKAASYVRAKVLGEVAIEQFKSAVLAANTNALVTRPAKVLGLLGRVEVLQEEGGEWIPLTAQIQPGSRSVIRLADASQVTLALAGGDEITLTGPGEVVLLDLKQDRRNDVVTSVLVVSQGLLEARVAKDKASGSAILVQAGGAEAQLSPGIFRVDASQVDDARLAAVRGSAVVQSGASSLSLPQGQAITLRGGQSAGLSKVVAPVILTKPASNKLSTSRQVIDFTWQPLPGRVTYLVDVARDPEFHDLLMTREVREPLYTTDVLTPGQYYVRISAVVNGVQGETTDTVSLLVDRNLDITFADLVSVPGKSGLIVGPGALIEGVPAKEDNSVHHVEYSVDGRAWETSDAGVKLPTSGQFEVKARGVGADGQLGKEIKGSYIVDGKIPDLRVHIGEVVDFPGYGKIRSLAVLVDDNTKVGTVTYSLNGSGPQEYELPLKLSITENQHLVIQARDVFGNLAETSLVLGAVEAPKASANTPVQEQSTPDDKRKGGFLGIF